MTKKFYWIKLKTDFFTREDIDFLLSQKNGAEYVVIYQILCLTTANTNGELKNTIGEIIVPFNAEKVARDCKYFDIDTVNVAMALYKKLGLIYEQEDGTLRISNYDTLVGSECTSAKRVREYRSRQKVLQCNNEVTQENRVKSIDNRDIDNKILDIKNIENITNKISDSVLENEFEELWKIYPNKKSKKDALRYYKSSRKKGTTYEEVLNGLNAYIDYITAERIDAKYIKHGSTWFNQECWNDDYLVRRKKTLKDISMAEIEEAIRKEQEAMQYN